MTTRHSISYPPNPQQNRFTDRVMHLYSIWRKLTPADFIVKQAIVDLGGDCTQPEIASLTGLCTRQVIRSCQKLAQYGLLIVSKVGRSNSYRLPEEAQTGDKQVTPLVTDSDSILNTTNTEGIKINDIPQLTADVAAYPAILSSPDHSELGQDADADTVGLEGGRLMHNSGNTKTDQLVLLADAQREALRALDIDPQQLPPAQQADLAQLDINPTLRQCFDTAPELIKQHTPAQVLMFFDPNGTIAANLSHWREQWQAGQADLTNLTPALIWTRIVEGKVPQLRLLKKSKLGSNSRDFSLPQPLPLGGESSAAPLGREPKSSTLATRISRGDNEGGRESHFTATPDLLSNLPVGESDSRAFEPESQVAPMEEVTSNELRMTSEGQSERQDSASVLWGDVLASLKGSVTKATYDRHLVHCALLVADDRCAPRQMKCDTYGKKKIHRGMRDKMGQRLDSLRPIE
ncbi:MAG: hypothetical protein AAF629_00010 [Chloroflexota bacterium]